MRARDEHRLKGERCSRVVGDKKQLRSGKGGSEIQILKNIQYDFQLFDLKSQIEVTEM